MIARITSLAVTPSGRLPSTATRMFLAGRWITVCVASTCSTSEVPMPKASAPNAPCVEVWLSPHTIVMPGSVRPCSGPITCTMPRRASSSPKYGTWKSATFFSSVSNRVRGGGGGAAGVADFLRKAMMRLLLGAALGGAGGLLFLGLFLLELLAARTLRRLLGLHREQLALGLGVLGDAARLAAQRAQV